MKKKILDILDLAATIVVGLTVTILLVTIFGGIIISGFNESFSIGIVVLVIALSFAWGIIRGEIK
jgi:cation transport ATPase